MSGRPPLDEGRVGFFGLGLTLAGWLLLVSLVMTPAVSYLGGRLGVGVTDADHLMLAELLPSLMSGTGLDDWTIPLANYAVPDWPMYGLSLMLGRTPTATIAVFMTLQTIALALAIHLNARAFDRLCPPLVVVVPLATVVYFTASAALPTAYLASSYNHFGTVILVLAAAGVTLHWLEDRSGRLLVLGGLLSFVAVFSDRIFVIWFLVPAAAAIAFLVIVRMLPLGTASRWLAVHVVVASVALPLPDVIFPTRTAYPVLFGQAGLRTGTLHYGASVKAAIGESSFQAISVVLFSLLLLWQLLRRRTFAGLSLPKPESTFLVVFLASVVVSVSTALSAMSGGVPPHMRHFLVLFVLPLVYLPVVSLAGAKPLELVGGFGADRGRLAVGLLAVVPVALSVGGLVPAVGNLSLDRSTVPVLCIEEAAAKFGSRRGLASYWDARPIEVFSQRRLDVASVSPRLQHDPTNADLTEFSRTYDFAVTSSHIPGWELPLEQLVHRAGEPAHQATCGRFTVSNWGPEGLDLYPTDDVGGSLAFSGCLLPSQLAAPGPDCTLAAAEGSSDGFLTFGPYIGLIPGRYRVELDVRSSASSATPVATWDVVFDGQTDALVDRGELVGTDGAWTTRTVELVVEPSSPRTVVEIRVDPTTGPVEIAGMRVERTA